MFGNFWKWFFAIFLGAIVPLVILGNLFDAREYRVKDTSVTISPNSQRVFEFETTSGRILNFNKDAEIIVASNDYFYLRQGEETNIIPDNKLSFKEIDEKDYVLKTDLIPVRKGEVEVKKGDNIHIWVLSSDVVTIKEYLTIGQKAENIIILFIIGLVITIFLRYTLLDL